MTAYRQSSTPRTILFCPRCNELLDQVDFGVDMCPRCEGFWIGTSVLALSGNQWPAGPQVWWRRELRCPACATQGVATTMNARTSAGLIIDQCFAHGVWLDRGELSRVLRDPAVQELAKLREHLAALEPSPVQLVERRERWRAEQDERARLAEIERKRIAAEQAKRAAEEAKTEQQRAEERRRADEDKLREAERLAEARRDAERAAEARRAAWQRVQAEQRIFEDRAAIAAAEEARRRGAELPEPPAVDDAARLAEQRANELRAERVERERGEIVRLTVARRSAQHLVDYLEARVDSLQHELTTMQERLAQARAALSAVEKELAAAQQRS